MKLSSLRRLLLCWERCHTVHGYILGYVKLVQFGSQKKKLVQFGGGGVCVCAAADLILGVSTGALEFCKELVISVVVCGSSVF